MDIAEAEHLHIVEGCSDIVTKISKEWGTEYILPTSPDYTVKYMSICPGAACSLHFHRNKHETFTLFQGELWIIYYTKEGDKKFIKLTKALDAFVIPPCTPHAFMVPTYQEFDTLFIESSTADSPDDSYRLSRSTSNVTNDSSDWGLYLRRDLSR